MAGHFADITAGRGGLEAMLRAGEAQQKALDTMTKGVSDNLARIGETLFKYGEVKKQDARDAYQMAYNERVFNENVKNAEFNRNITQAQHDFAVQKHKDDAAQRAANVAKTRAEASKTSGEAYAIHKTNKSANQIGQSPATPQGTNDSTKTNTPPTATQGTATQGTATQGTDDTQGQGGTSFNSSNIFTQNVLNRAAGQQGQSSAEQKLAQMAGTERKTGYIGQ